MKIVLCAVSVLFMLSFNSCSYLKPKKETPEDKISLAEVISKSGYETTVYFDVSSYSLNFKMEDILKRLARLQHLSKTEVYLHGHADITGIKELNLILSENRVESVKKYLIKLGVKDEIIHTSYYGDQAPAVLGETPDVFAKNRRVEIELRPVKTDIIAQEAKSGSWIAESDGIQENNINDTLAVQENDAEKTEEPLVEQSVGYEAGFVSVETENAPYQETPAEINENKEAGDTGPEQVQPNDFSAEEQPFVYDTDKDIDEKTEDVLSQQQEAAEPTEESNKNNIDNTSNEMNTEPK